MTGNNGETPTTGAYGREDVCRIAAITPRQLRTWEKQGLVKPATSFGFADLLALKTLKRLRLMHVAPKHIRAVIASLKTKVGNIDQPLAQLRITAEGKKITVYVAGNRMEPISGQLIFDFDAKEIEKLKSFPVPAPPVAPEPEINAHASEQWFQRGLELEESGAPVEDAVAAYRKAIEANPHASGALVNLGTIAFRMRKMNEASAFYLRALEADPTYPLAHFNLGNLYDEQGNFELARKHYAEAVRLSPRYSDAYFNLALLCERTSDMLQAIGYWQTYLKLDSSSQWATAARKQLDRLKRSVRSK